MISYIKGPLIEAAEGRIVVEAGSMGFNIYVPMSIFDKLPAAGETVTIYTSFQVREDAMNLYGFMSRQDRAMFEQLIGVNGIGPKAALGILSVLSPDELRMAIISSDAKLISKAPGVGAKTAQRLILDLKDKINADDILQAAEEDSSLHTGSTLHTGALKEAVDALTALGYSPAEASGAVKKVEIYENMTAEDILKQSLKHLTFL